MYKDHIFREYDIRGVVGDDYDLQFARQLGQAYGSYLADQFKKKITVTIGYDARLSSPEIVEALTEGFLSTGTDVLSLGLITTPMSYFSMFHLEVDGGIMVTGSHNPPEYNGFKISKGKSTIFGEEILKLREIISRGQFLKGQGKTETYDISGPYVEKHQKEFQGIKNVPVVLDCGNGAAGAIVRRLYESVGLKPHILFEEPDGRFPNHHPDPTVEENTEDMKRAVKEHHAAIGIGFDGDADRIGVVSDSGRFVLGDEIMMIVARDILQSNPGAKIIGDVKCSDRLYEYIKKHGGEPIMWKTGHSLIKNKIKLEQAPFGGELSGHIFFSDRNYGYDDAPYAGLRMIEILSKLGKNLDELLEEIPPGFSTPEIRIDTSEENKTLLVKKLQEHYSNPKEGLSVNKIDGVRISYPNGWALVRSSNTQPAITLRFEADSASGLETIKNQVMEVVTPLL